MVTYKINKPTVSHSNSDSDKKPLIIVAILSLFLLVITSFIAKSHQLSGTQARIFYDLNNLSNSYRFLGLGITELLGAGYPIIIFVLGPLLFKKYRLAWRFFFTTGGAFTVAYAIKKIINEPRPVVMLSHHLQQRAIETGPGFPSGHEVIATAIAITLFFILPKRWRFLSLIWILAVALSRIYLGVHTPVDVVGGFAIGLLAVCFVRLLPKIIAQKIFLSKD